MKQQLKALRQQAAKQDAEMERLQGKLKMEEKKQLKRYADSKSKYAVRSDGKRSKLSKNQVSGF